MASSYTISTGTGRVSLGSPSLDLVGLQVVADAALNSDISVKLQQSSDGVNFFDLANTTKTLSSGGDSAILQSFDFNLNELFIYIDVQSATLGELTLFSFDKKKVEPSSGTIPNPLPVEVENQLLNETNLDAFNRLRVSDVNSQIDLKQLHDSQPLFYDIEAVNGGSSSYGVAETTISTTSNNDRVFVQTKQRFNYSSGKSAYFLISFRNFNAASTNIKRIGYFNSGTTSPYNTNLDGLFLEIRQGEVNFVIAKDGVLTRHVQSTWSDPMDGTGASAIDFYLGSNDGNLLLWCDFEWLGVGQVRFGFVYQGAFIIASKFDHILDDGVYMKSPNHSIRAEIIQQTGTAQDLTLICATYGTEGSINTLGKILSDNMGNTHVDANNTSSTYALMGLRLATSKIDTLVDLLSFTLLAITNDNQRWEIWLNPTVAGTFTYAAVTNSSIETAKGSGSGNTVTTTSATLLASGYVNANSAEEFSIKSAIRLGMTIAGVQDEIVLCTSPLTSNSDVIASVTWQEVS